MTKKFITPISKTEIETKEWITGREAEEIDAVLYAGVEVKPNASRGIDFGKFNPEIIDKQAHKELEMFIISVNGNAQNILKAVLDLPEADYKFIKAEISAMRAKKKEPAGI